MPMGAAVDGYRVGQEKGTCWGGGPPPQGAGDEWQLSSAPAGHLTPPPVLYRH